MEVVLVMLHIWNDSGVQIEGELYIVKSKYWL